jgi:fucose 4-O-acetylase-like acetyltransferase
LATRLGILRAVHDASATLPQPEARAGRRLDIDRARGLGILLVVFGHLMARSRPPDMLWYEAAFIAVYAFHMPFFLYLSGLTAGISGQMEKAPAAWPELQARRAERLLLPFLLMGFVIVVGKSLAQSFLPVDNAPASLWSGVRDAFWTTETSPVTMIWYLWVLFFTGVIVPPLLRVPGLSGAWRFAPALALGILLFVTALPPVAYLNKLADHFFFFPLGLLVAWGGAAWMRVVDRVWPIALGLLAALCAATVMGFIDRRWALMVCGLAAAPALHGLVRAIGDGATGGVLLWLGRYSMAIYLFNTIFIGLAKAVLLKAGLAWTAAGATIAVPVLMAAGVLGPVLFKLIVLRRVRYLDRLTD